MLPLDTTDRPGIEGFYEYLDTSLARLRQSMKGTSVLLSRLAAASRSGRAKAIIRCLAELLRVTTEFRDSLVVLNRQISELGVLSSDAEKLLAEVFEQCQRIQLPNVQAPPGALTSYPVKLVARGSQVFLDGKALDTTRPLAVATRLRELRDRAEAHADGLLDATFYVYETLLKAKNLPLGDPISITEIYSGLAPLPASRKAYPEGDFLTDLYWHVSSGNHTTDGGHVLSLLGSTTTGGGRGYRIVAMDGSEVVCSMLEFRSK